MDDVLTKVKDIVLVSFARKFSPDPMSPFVLNPSISLLNHVRVEVTSQGLTQLCPATVEGSVVLACPSAKGFAFKIEGNEVSSSFFPYVASTKYDVHFVDPFLKLGHV